MITPLCFISYKISIKEKRALYVSTFNETFFLLFEQGTWHFPFALSPTDFVAGPEQEQLSPHL